MKKAEKRKKTGRPPLKPEDRRLPSMAFRPTRDLRKMLEDAAAQSGRSLSQEIEYRLWRSEIGETDLHYKFGSAQNYAVALTLARLADEVASQAFASSWLDDEKVFREVRKAFNTFLDGIAPPAGTASSTRKVSGKERAEIWLETIPKFEGDRAKMKATGTHLAPNNPRQIIFEVESEITPLIGRKK